jgi:hypothetical protein
LPYQQRTSGFCDFGSWWGLEAALTGLTVWPLEPIPPGTSRRIVVELDAAESEARGTYTLKLWAGEAGAGGVNVDGVTFP